MAVASEKLVPEGKVWSLCKLPFWHSTNSAPSSSSSSSSSSFRKPHDNVLAGDHHPSILHSTATSKATSMSIKSFLPTRRRLSLDPSNKLYFPYEPGKQVRSAIRIKNVTKAHVAFKFQTTAPKSCYMRPPGGILAPNESIIATVFKFVEPPENNEKPVGMKSRVKFKIMSLKVKGDMDYVAELFDEQKDEVAVEQILRVIFLDAEHPCPALEKLNRQLAEAEAELEARKKPPEDNGPKIVGEGLVIDEWKERRERYLARQQVDGMNSV
ncbi:vesicle-associated protein 4-2-like [Ipomoea triloba]|uniref:vesicle-associated protein 4-2-like n=1 Tax=Ipomoea triloba TaxID=35885 RepID=UPI00125DEABB|nr:vesicle-associated protein 4-2-like [Ipomoea triloba]